jgi:hypothetical protein
MFFKYPIICSHVYCYSNHSLTPRVKNSQQHHKLPTTYTHVHITTTNKPTTSHNNITTTQPPLARDNFASHIPNNYHHKYLHQDSTQTPSIHTQDNPHNGPEYTYNTWQWHQPNRMNKKFTWCPTQQQVQKEKIALVWWLQIRAILFHNVFVFY